jgi:hypothetical protein
VPSGGGSIEAGSYILDIIAPTITSTIPGDAITGVATTAGIYVIQFSKAMTNIGTPLSDLPGISWSWSVNDLWLNGTYTLLGTNTAYYVDLTGQGFVDSLANALIGDMYKTFTTEVLPPTATIIGPTSTGTNDDNPLITYSYTNSPSSVEIYYSPNTGTTWILWGTDTVVDGNWNILGLDALPASGTYYWNARAMGTPNEAVPSGAGSIEASSYVLDIIEPTIISTTPSDIANGVSVNAGTFVIQFSEAMANVGTPSSNLLGVSWVWSANDLWLNGTYTLLTSNTVYTIDLSGLGFTDVVSNALTGDMLKTFTTEILMSTATVTGPSSAGTNIDNPEITYTTTNSPSSVEIYYSINGGTLWTLWGTDLVVDGSWNIFGTSSLPSSGTYRWSARGIGASSEAVPSGAGSIEAGSYILDITAPTISSTTPADSLTGVSKTAGTYVIRFSEAMTNVGTPTTNLPGISWTWSANDMWLNGTYTTLAYNTVYYVDLTGRGFVDVVGNALTGDIYKIFTTELSILPLPVILNLPYNPSSAGTTLDLSWSQYDNGASNFASYNIYMGSAPGFTLGPSTYIGKVTTLTTLSVTVTGLTIQTQYYFVVRVNDTLAQYADSNEVYSRTFTSSDTGNNFASARTVNAGEAWSEDITAIFDSRDYYRIWLTAGQTLVVNMICNALGDPDLYLYNPSQTLLVSSTNGTGSSENVSTTAASTGWYYLKVEVGFVGTNWQTVWFNVT